WTLPFQIVVRNFYQNSRLKMLSQAGEGARPIANQGPGAMIAVEPAPPATAADERDVPSAAIEILPKDGSSLGTWLVSDALGAPQTFACGGRTWMIRLRSEEHTSELQSRGHLVCRLLLDKKDIIGSLWV